MTAGEHPSGSRWAEVDRLFEAALDKPEADRAAFLAGACGDDRELREAVQALLDAVDASEGRFETPAPAVAQEALTDLAARAEPTLPGVAPYEILGEIGRGGMGTVYSAERRGDGFRQRVALKVLRRGLDTDDILRRFRTERHILASLTHPNIARLYDGGTTDDGRPYLVMEHVEGRPITGYCDAARLTIRARLELLLQVIDAVAAAHVQLVVHRDLKPSNILVTTDGHVKLLDFGIAKLLDAGEGSGHTHTGAHVLTPEYASPEQLRGEPVTTATDVYQLGVLLFELLTGRLPHPARARSKSGLEALAPGEPPRPASVVQRHDDREAVAGARSTTPERLRAAITGDLETIVLKALAPEPTRRYSTTGELARDLRSFLANRPVSARPVSRWYRTRKFASRNPWVMPAAALLAVVFIAYVVLVTRHAAELERERNVARTEAERADQVRQFLVDLFRSADPSLPADPERGRQITVVEALDIGAGRLQTELRDRPALRAPLLSAISEVYFNLGVSGRARPLREEALALEQALYGDASPEARASLGHLGKILSNLGEREAGLEALERRLALARAAEPAAPGEVARARLDLGLHYHSVGRPEDAAAHVTAIIAQASDGTVSPGDLAEAHRLMADVHQTLDRFEPAEASAREALALQQQVFGEDSVGAGTAHITLAENLGATRRFAEAGEHFEAGLRILEQRLGEEHEITLSSLNNLAVLRQHAGDLAGAEALHRRVLDIRLRVHGPEHALVAGSHQNLATIVGLQGRYAEAEALHAKARDLYRRAVGPDSYFLALPSLSLSSIYLKTGRYASAESAARQARAILERALPAGHFITAVAECRLAQALAATNRLGAAEPLFERSTAVLLETTSVPQYRDECFDAALTAFDRLGQEERAAALRQARSGG